MEDNESSKTKGGGNAIDEKVSCELNKILEDLKITGEIKDKNHPLVFFIDKKKNQLKDSRIRYSYTHSETKWKEFNKEENVYLFRITKIIDNETKKRIKKEFELHKDSQDLDEMAPKFICYYFSKFLNFSVFVIDHFYTLEEILEGKKLPNLSNNNSFLEFSKDQLILATAQTIFSLKSEEEENQKYYLCPYITPSDLLYTEKTEYNYFFLSEIFLLTDSIEKEEKFRLKNPAINDWLAAEFVNNEANLSFSSNISCLGNILYKILFNEDPKKPLKIPESSLYKELFDNCMNGNRKERWSIEQILEYIDKHNFEEEAKKQKESVHKESMEIKDEENKNTINNNDGDNIIIKDGMVNNIEGNNKDQNINMNDIDKNNNILLNKINDNKNNLIINNKENIRLDKNQEINKEIIFNNIDNNTNNYDQDKYNNITKDPDINKKTEENSKEKNLNDANKIDKNIDNNIIDENHKETQILNNDKELKIKKNEINNKNLKNQKENKNIENIQIIPEENKLIDQNKESDKIKINEAKKSNNKINIPTEEKNQIKEINKINLIDKNNNEVFQIENQKENTDQKNDDNTNNIDNKNEKKGNEVNFENEEDEDEDLKKLRLKFEKMEREKEEKLKKEEEEKKEFEREKKEKEEEEIKLIKLEEIKKEKEEKEKEIKRKKEEDKKRKLEQKKLELQKKLEEQKKELDDIDNRKKKREEEQEREKKEKERKKEEEEKKKEIEIKKREKEIQEQEEKDRKEKELLEQSIEKLKDENKKYDAKIEKNKKEEEKRKEEQEKRRKEEEKREEEIRIKEEEIRKKEDEKRKEEEEKRNEEIRKRNEEKEIEIRKRREKQKEIEKQEKEKKEEEERQNKKKEEEKRKKEELQHAENFPDGISTLKENNANKKIEFIHLEIKFKGNSKEIEIFDINGPSKQGYKFIEIENNKYYIVFPFYKCRELFFGIRDTKENKLIDNNDIFGKNLNYDRNNNKWELTILKSENCEMIFNIYNVPKEINKINYFKFLSKIDLKNYTFTQECVREVTSILKYNEVIDLIMEIYKNKKHNLTEMLVKIIIDSKIDIYHICHYLEKNKNSKFKDKFYEIAPYIIYLFKTLNIDNEEIIRSNHKVENNYGGRKSLLCLDNNIPINLYPENYQKDLIEKTIENLGKLSIDENKNLQIKREEINKKLTEYNLIQKSQGSKQIICILTDTTVKKLSQLEFGIKANIPMIIQGFTSAGKSFLSTVASKINKRECLSTALSEHTTIDDLLGRDIIKSDSSIKFIPGILLLAYKDGKTLILDECDLAKPEILSCILGSMSKNELIICNQIFRKMEGYNVVLTMNGEVKGFNEKQRNILTSNILSKFILIQFDEMEKEECLEIFKSLLNQNNNDNSKGYIKYIDIFIDIHQQMINLMKIKEEEKKNNNNIITIDPIVTLRNLKYCYYLSRNNIHPRIAAEISYTSRFPKSERSNFENILNKFGKINENLELKELIEKNIKNNFLYYNDTYKKAIYLSLTALKEGLHPLLIGEKGSGLTTVAKFLASLINKDYEFLFCSSETSVEDLMGCYQPKLKNTNKIQDLSSYIKWCDGPVPRAGKKGVPIILDNINYSKPQVIECLNPLLEDNSKYNNVEYNILEKENEGPIQMLEGFSIIGTMCLDNENKNTISKALLNRFVAIYFDNDIEINNDNLNLIIENRCKMLNKQIKEVNLLLEKTKENQDNKNNKENDSDNEENEEEQEEINDDENKIKIEETKEIPEWYNINKISEQTIKQIQVFFTKENIRTNNFKTLIKKITKLALVYERINKFGFSIEDCFDFMDLKFKQNNENYKNLQKEILINSQEKKNRFFFDDFNSDSWIMIMSLISSNISNTSIFLQGSPGSGKSCAARHFGAYRIFQNRNPILSVNCHRDLKFDYLVGNYNFKDSKFNFIDGPLITAMKRGECILLDEFNLCPESVLINLLPIFKASLNDEIYLKGVPDPIRIIPGFLIIATGNNSKEKGRNVISSMILDEILIQEINSLNLMANTTLIKNILENEYKEIYQENDKYEIDKISAEQIKQLDEILKEDIQFKLSLRQIKCLLERITRFCLEENYNIGGFKKIPVIYVIISYIIPQLKIGKNKLETFLEKLDKIMKYNNLTELMEFISSKVEFEYTYIKNRDKEENRKFIKKGKIHLISNMNENILPQVTKEAYFWIRMSCYLKSESPSEENLLLAGTTSYKEYLLNEWLSLKLQKEKAIDIFFLTKNTETENLIGTSSLDDENKLNIQIKYLIDNAIIYFHLELNGIEDDDYEEKFKLIKKSKKENHNIILNYIYENILKLKKLKRSFYENNNQIGLKTVTSFNLGIVPKAFIFGKKLILKGIENPESSVIERLNPILENPRHLIITEDNQEIYNDDKIFRKIYKDNIKSVPLNNTFRIFFTSREVFQVKLSKALISRLTIINCPNYENENYLTIRLNPEINYEIICKSIIEEDDLVKEIINFNKLITEIEKIEFLRFIRWCKSTKNIYNKLKNIKYKTILYKENKDDNFSLNYKFIIGISALRSIIDRFESKYREYIIKNYFKDYLPEKLFNLLTSEFNNNLESCPLELIENEGKKYVISIYSGIILEFPENEEPNYNILKEIEWTKSSVDIADAIIVALISNTILVLEGPPGRGKTAISRAVYNYLNIDRENLKRINFSPSTIIEDVFARTIPKIDGEKVSTERKPQGLLTILELSQNSENYYKHGLILDEINLASDILLEYLYSYLDSLLKHEDYISPDGVKYKNIGNIGIITTMNDAKLSNSRTSLSNSFINRCHLFKLADYSSNEKELLAEKILSKCNKKINDETFKMIMKCFQISEIISSQYSNIYGNTFREILKLKQFIDKCEEIPIDYLLELILSRNIPQSEMEKFQAETGLKMISNSLNDLKLKIENNYLCFDKFVKYKLINPKKYEIKSQFTISQKETLMKMMIGLLAERPILLTGDIGTGKTFIVEQLANLIGVNLKIIQFNSETTSLDIIGRLELTIDKDKINKVFNSIKNFIDHLIEIEYKNITEFIVESEFKDIERIRIFLEKNKESFCDYTDNIQDEFNNVKIQLDNLIGIKKTHFDFKLSALVNAMKEGDWVLLDDINFSPQEIEGLMSLLEEEPTLKIYENDPVLFYTKDRTKIRNEKTDFLIHPNFRLIMTTSKDTNISPAIKSRCLCIQIKPFKEPKDYGELIANNLKYSDIEDNNIIDISKKIGYGFFKLKENEDQSNYILKNYILSSVNLVNLTKLIIFSQPIDDKKLSQIIEFCIFSAFKRDSKKNEFIESFKKCLKEDIDFKITPIRNIKRSHEYYLKKCEINILSYYYNKKKEEDNHIMEKINMKIKDLFNNQKITELKENMIIKNIKEEEIIRDIPRKNLLSNIESFTLDEIKEYINDIDEIIVIFQAFIEANTDLYQYLYFLNYLKKILSHLNLIKEEKLNGIKISTIKCNKEYFLKYGIEEDLAIKYTKIFIWFNNMINYFDKIIPEKISIIYLEKSLISLCYKYCDNLRVNFPFKKDFKIKIDQKSSQNFEQNHILYFYPRQFYKEEKLVYLFFFFELFIKEYLDSNEIKKIITEELYNFNFDINTIFEENKLDSNDGGKQIIWKTNYVLIDIIKIGYKLLEATRDIKEEDKIKFNKGINIFNKDNSCYLEVDEDNINIILEKIDIINEYFNKYLKNNLFLSSISYKYKILELKKKKLIYKNEQNEMQRKLKVIETKYRDILKDETFKMFNQDIKKIREDINLNKDKKNIELNIKNLEIQLDKIEKSKQKSEENPKDSVHKQISVNARILYTYSKLFSIIEEFKVINLDTDFLNRVDKFQKLMKKSQMNIDIFSAYKEQIFTTCENNSLVSQHIIEIFKHIANSYLISEIVKNNLENGFSECLIKLIKIEESIINDIILIFDENEYITLPKLSNKDIIYCFSYGEDNYKAGELNPTRTTQVIIDENENLSRKEYLNNINIYFKKAEKKENHLKLIDKHLSKIDIFFSNMEKMNYDMDIAWLIKPIETLKNEAAKYPNRVIIKNNYGFSEDLEKKLFDGEKILTKVLYALFEGNKKINSIYGEKTILNEIITNIQNSNKNYLYGYRIMGFYDFKLFEDNNSKTMELIIETINSILKNEFRENLINKDVKNIYRDVLGEFIDLILSSKTPKFEDTRAVHFFEILFYSFLTKFKIKYQELIALFVENKKKLYEIIDVMIKQISEKIDSKIAEYKIKYDKYLIDNERDEAKLKKQTEERALKYYNRKNKFMKICHNIKDYLFDSDKIEEYKKTDEYKNWIYNRNRIDEPFKDQNWEIYKKKLKEIKKILNRMKNETNLNEIKSNINNITTEFENINYKEINKWAQYHDLVKKIFLNINKIDKMDKKELFLQEKIPDHIKIGNEVQENNLERIYQIILLCYKNFSLFKIDPIQIVTKNIYKYISENMFTKQGSNFIFSKNDNKPAFLNKFMKINLGLYILGYELKKIGSVTIPNNYNCQLKCSLKQNPDNEIIVFFNDNKDLEPYKDLQINFKLNIKKTPGFYSSKFELILMDENKEHDKCIVHTYINIIPLIMKFSIPDIKFSLSNNNISISHYVKDIKIIHSFPGNYSSERLGFKLLKFKNGNKINHTNENIENKGHIIINPEFGKNNKDMNFEFNLSLLSISLNFKVEYKNPLLLGIRIFDEENVYLKTIKILKNNQKHIFLFNMSNEN